MRESPRRIYMDYQASTPIDPRVSKAMAPYFFDQPGNPHSADHTFGWEANAAIEKAAQQIASAINADPDEIIFTSGATEANNLAILGAAARAPENRRRILVSAVEHKCVLAAARITAARFGFTIELIPVDHNGVVCLDVLEDRLDNNVLLVSVMAVNNEIGTIEPIAAVTAMCHDVGALVHTDAVQALAAGPLDTQHLDVEFLSLSAHKIYGPKGIGALYIRRDVQRQIEPLIYGGGQQNGIRAGTLPVPLCVGFGEAAALMTGKEASNEHVRLRRLRDQLIERICGLGNDIRLNGPTSDVRHPGNANLCFTGLYARDLLAALQPRIAASTASACVSGIPDVSHVLRAIGLSILEAEGSVRFSIGRFTTEADIDEAVAALQKTLPRFVSGAFPSGSL